MLKRALLILPVIFLVVIISLMAQSDTSTGSCENFQLINPTQVRNAPTGYEWTSVGEAAAYLVEFAQSDTLDSPAGSYTVFAPQTRIYLDVTDIIGLDLRWRVSALDTDNNVRCSTEQSDPIREVDRVLNNCMDFRIIEPLTVFSYEVTYRWSRVNDADAYKVMFWRRDDGEDTLAVEFVGRGTEPRTTMTIAMGDYPTGSQVQWEVLALKNGAILCSTGRTAIADRVIAPLSGSTAIPGRELGGAGAVAPQPPTPGPTPTP
ncbi:MAG: hypothetical protein ACPG7F_12215 [Aggregatilineales bacterium]